MRPSREEALVATALVWSRRSTCSRLQVGCVIHRDGRILVQGYNGSPAGMPHCVHLPGDDSPCLVSEHAERNAIAWAARWGVALADAHMVSTHQPCLSCAMSIINSGITRVTYIHPYRLQDGLYLLREAGVRIDRHLDEDDPETIG